MTRLLLAGALVAACADPPPPFPTTSTTTSALTTCVAPVLVNPSFEQPVVAPAPHLPFTNTLPGWKGIVDVHDRSDLPVAHGNQVVDLNQSSRMLDLSQAVALTPGAQYELRFSHAVNHHCTATAEFEVRVGGAYRSFSSDATMREERMFFIARQAASSLSFTSLTEGCGAATIDDIHLTCSDAPREWPNADSAANSDAWLLDHHDAISVMRPRIGVINYSNFLDVDALVDQTVAAISEGSRFHGATDPTAPSFLLPEVVARYRFADTELFDRQLWRKQTAPWSANDRWLVGDFDGRANAAVDLARVFDDGTGQISIDVSLGQHKTFLPPGGWARTAGGFSADQRWLSGDIDGDGKADLVNVFREADQVAVDVHHSTGSGFTRKRWLTGGGPVRASDSWLIADIDRDGRADLLQVFDEGGLVSVDAWLSTAFGFFNQRNWVIQQGPFAAANRWLAGDVDGDAYPDLVQVLDEGGLIRIDVRRSIHTAFGPAQRWATGNDPFFTGQRWRIGDFDRDGKADVAVVFGASAPGAKTLISIDVYRSSAIGFTRARWQRNSGGFAASQQWIVADANGGGFADLVNVWEDAGSASVDVHILRANHAVPRLASAPEEWDYAAMFEPGYTDVLGLGGSGLCDLFERGELHELWVYVDDIDPTSATMHELAESKPVRDRHGAAIPGRFERCAGNGCFSGAAVAAAAACGRSIRIAYGNPRRGAGCLVHSLGHGIETIGGAPNRFVAQDVVPPLATDFRRFANFDLATRLSLPHPTWYQMCADTQSTPNLGCGAADPGACMELTSASSLNWRAPPLSGTIPSYNQGCGSVHFPANARDDDDYASCTAVYSSCETFGTTAPWRLYNGMTARGMDPLAPDCGGGWQIYWRQQFPNAVNRLTTTAGIPIPNWWPYLYY